MKHAPTKAADIEFAFLHDPDEEDTVIEMSIKASPEYDGGLGHLIGDFWPADLIMDEVMENTFSFYLSEAVVKERLVRAGFEFSESFQKILDDYTAL